MYLGAWVLMSISENPATCRTFEELEKASSTLITILGLDKELTTEAIDELAANGWSIDFITNYVLVGGISKEDRKIKIRQNLVPYERDITLFHELAHIFFGDDLNRHSDDTEELVAEYFGRKWRSDPTLLRHTLQTFGLQPVVYDYISQIAFPEEPGQLCFPWYVLC